MSVCVALLVTIVISIVCVVWLLIRLLTDVCLKLRLRLRVLKAAKLLRLGVMLGNLVSNRCLMICGQVTANRTTGASVYVVFIAVGRLKWWQSSGGSSRASGAVAISLLTMMTVSGCRTLEFGLAVSSRGMRLKVATEVATTIGCRCCCVFLIITWLTGRLCVVRLPKRLITIALPNIVTLSRVTKLIEVGIQMHLFVSYNVSMLLISVNGTPVSISSVRCVSLKSANSMRKTRLTVIGMISLRWVVVCRRPLNLLFYDSEQLGGSVMLVVIVLSVLLMKLMRLWLVMPVRISVQCELAL